MKYIFNDHPNLKRFLDMLSNTGQLFFPTTSALFFRNNKSLSIIEIYSENDYYPVLKENFTPLFIGHPDFDAFFEIEDFFICFKQINSISELYANTQQAMNTNLNNFYYRYPEQSYLDQKNVQFDLKYGMKPTRFQSIYYYLKALVLKYELDLDYELIAPESGNRTLLNPEWKLFHHMLGSTRPGKYIRELAKTGILFEFFPILKELQRVEHMKDFHPEGNALEHTIGCMDHIKRPALSLALGTLFHDIGKPFVNEKYKDSPFYQHAQIGADIAHKELSSKGYSQKTISDVCYLVQYHMMPHCLPKIPLHIVEPIAKHACFEELLKLHRADTLSTYSNDSTYHQAVRYYKKVLRKRYVLG